MLTVLYVEAFLFDPRPRPVFFSTVSLSRSTPFYPCKKHSNSVRKWKNDSPNHKYSSEKSARGDTTVISSIFSSKNSEYI